MTIADAKQQAKATVFVNINGEAQTTPDRRLGWWRMDSRKLEKVKTVLLGSFYNDRQLIFLQIRSISKK